MLFIGGCAVNTPTELSSPKVAPISVEAPNASSQSADINPIQILDLDNRCTEKGIAGPCESMAQGYQFNPQTNKCESFFWGGCEGYRPFNNLEECQATCETGL